MQRLVAPSEKSLAEILYQQQQLGETIPVPLTLAILRQVCDALAWAHNLTDANGHPMYILHRDVCPANIFVGHTGVARLVASTAAQANCAYVAPEVLVGLVPDPRADLFSLGVVAHEMLTNRPLFLGVNEHDTLSRICTFPIPLPTTVNPAVTADIEGIVLMALARDPTYRWQSAGMMRDGLASVAQRHGFELGPSAANLWYALFMGYPAPRPEPVLPSVQFSAPEPQVIAPPMGAPPMEAPPAGEWSDDTNNETQLQPVDPRLQDKPANTPRPELRTSETPRPELRTNEPSQRTPRPDLGVADLPKPRPVENGVSDLPSPRAKQPTGQQPPRPKQPTGQQPPRPKQPTGQQPPASNALFEDLPAPRAKQPTGQAPPASKAPFEDLPAPRTKQPTGQPPRAKQPTGQSKPISNSLFEDLPSPKAKGIEDLPAPHGEAARFANLPAPRAPEPLAQPNQRGVALEDLPPPEKPRPAEQRARPADSFDDMELPGGGNQHQRASTADVDAFLSSVNNDPELDQVSHVPASAPPGPPPINSPQAGFELELGEFTQIGAAPLISFGNTGETPIALVGVGPRQQAPRTSAPTLPPPVTMVATTRVGDADDDDDDDRRKKLLIVLGAVLVLVAAVVAFVLISD